mmetsp:Transcript_35183/g.80539  ORF Transcript_35183/g.80539 Transcript_35183/m.80539 type:complete len:101 (+) Transcript_35183:841-1143(+)
MCLGGTVKLSGKSLPRPTLGTAGRQSGPRRYGPALAEEQLDAPDDACRLLGYVDDYIIAIAPGYERLVMDTWSQAIERMMEFSVTGALDVTADSLQQGCD